MDTKIDSIKDDLPPGGQTKFSTIMNGVGNYSMLLGGGLFVGKQAYNLFTPKPTGTPMDKWAIAGIALAAVGAVIGAVHGSVEATNIQRYREAIADKIDGLNREVKADKAKIQDLYNKVQAQAQHQGRAA